jgi:hypothetical protein
MADLSGTVIASLQAGAEQTHEAASSISGARLDHADCVVLGRLLTQVLANLVTVTERLAEGIAVVGTKTPLQQKIGGEPKEPLANAAQHLADLRARLSSAVAASSGYGNAIGSLEETDG